MHDIAKILSHFKGYNQCVDAFIEQIQLQQYRGKDIFKEIVPLCDTSWKLIEKVGVNLEFSQVFRRPSSSCLPVSGLPESAASDGQVRAEYLPQQVERAHQFQVGRQEQ